MLILQHVSYLHPDKTLLFDRLSLTIRKNEKLALVGNNGVGKSTLLRLIAGHIKPSEGIVQADETPYYVPQIYGQYDHLTIAGVLKIDERLHALERILSGDTSEEYFDQLQDDWSVEERSREALARWGLTNTDLHMPISSLSGGEKTKVLLAGVMIYHPEFVLLDEPSNHLDVPGRNLLYEFIRDYPGTIMIASHDRNLLCLVEKVCELDKRGVTVYGGNYDFYRAQKRIETEALSHDVRDKENELRKAREKERETIERQQRLDARGKNKQEKSGVARIMMNTLRNKAENSTARTKGIHTEKIEGIAGSLQRLRRDMPDSGRMKLDFDDARLHKGKLLFAADKINYTYNKRDVWSEPVSLQVYSGERIVLTGVNGSGKTTLIKIMLQQLIPETGTVYHAIGQSVYIDQDYSLINNDFNVYEQVQQFNISGLQEHEVKIRLNRFLFHKEFWTKPCMTLSGGERMRLMLCCLNIMQQAPDMIILDEPTNNLDLQNVDMLTIAVNDYKGTLIVVSHDAYFLEQVQVMHTVCL